MDANNFELRFDQNPELAEKLSGKKPGDKCTMELTVQVNQVDESGIKGTIEEIAFDDSYDGEEEPVEPDGEHPTAIKIIAGPSGKKEDYVSS